jgi:transcriptional regulator with XRE-family HTH domain
MVKKTTQAIPNQPLRRARLERGWTQRVVAERIGAPNDIMITRWERGTAFPSPYYIERLCQLFELRASDLGLLKEAPPMAFSSRPKSSQRGSGSPEEQARRHVSTISTMQRQSPAAPLSSTARWARSRHSRSQRELPSCRAGADADRAHSGRSGHW